MLTLFIPASPVIAGTIALCLVTGIVLFSFGLSLNVVIESYFRTTRPVFSGASNTPEMIDREPFAAGLLVFLSILAYIYRTPRGPDALEVLTIAGLSVSALMLGFA